MKVGTPSESASLRVGISPDMGGLYGATVSGGKIDGRRKEGFVIAVTSALDNTVYCNRVEN
jgi:hypothetical protein